MIRWLKHRCWTQLRQALRQWRDDDGNLLSAAISYYAALSIFPFLLVLTSAFGFILRFSGRGRDAEQRLIHMVSEQTSESLTNQVQEAFAAVQGNATISGPLGIITLLFAAMAMFVHLDRGFDRVWKLESPKPSGALAAIRRVLLGRLRAFLMLLSVGLLVIVLFIAAIVLTAVRRYTNDLLPDSEWVWTIGQAATIVIVNSLLFMLIYKIMPKTPVRWSAAWGGGILASAIWEVGRQILAAFIIGDKYSAYGVIGSFIAVMFWIYSASAVLYLGAEYVQVLSTDAHKPEHEKEPVQEASVAE